MSLPNRYVVVRVLFSCLVELSPRLAKILAKLSTLGLVVVVVALFDTGPVMRDDMTWADGVVDTGSAR
jgi:hypothetical protein